jgi:hypothetical protein
LLLLLRGDGFVAEGYLFAHGAALRGVSGELEGC